MVCKAYFLTSSIGGGGGGPTLFLSVDFVNILPKSGGEQTLIELDPPPVIT